MSGVSAGHARLAGVRPQAGWVLEVAGTPWQRLRGCIGRSVGRRVLCLVPCMAVHTGLMRQPLDVYFFDGRGACLLVVRALPPWRCAWQGGAVCVVETAAGRFAAADMPVLASAVRRLLRQRRCRLFRRWRCWRYRRPWRS